MIQLITYSNTHLIKAQYYNIADKTLEHTQTLSFIHMHFSYYSVAPLAYIHRHYRYNSVAHTRLALRVSSASSACVSNEWGQQEKELWVG